MGRVTCYRCFWPQKLCWCDSITPMPTRTKFVLLMHPKEFKREKANTGRLAHLCLPNSEIQMGMGFDDNEIVQRQIADPEYHSVLLYPGLEAHNLSSKDPLPSELSRKPLQVFIIDATWSGARKMLRISPTLQRLPRIMFIPTAPSRYVIKHQPQQGCLSTLESMHELLTVLEKSGLDTYSLPEQLHSIFDRMQKFQMDCASDSTLGGYRRQAYGKTSDRKPFRGKSGSRRRYLKIWPNPPEAS